MATTEHDLATGGRSLWDAVNTDHPALDAVQKVQLLEACRAKDRLDKLDGILSQDAEGWVDFVECKGHPGAVDVFIDKALAEANRTANQMKQLLAAIRLPDAATGKRPQQRGGARGTYKPRAGTVTSIADRYAAAGL